LNDIYQYGRFEATQLSAAYAKMAGLALSKTVKPTRILQLINPSLSTTRIARRQPPSVILLNRKLLMMHCATCSLHLLAILYIHIQHDMCLHPTWVFRGI
jgi:hypothetical protein